MAEMHGSRQAVYDLLLDAGARFTAHPTQHEATVLWGIPVVYDESMPQTWVDMRDGDGVLTKRLIQMRDGSWASMDAVALRELGTEVDIPLRDVRPHSGDSAKEGSDDVAD